LIGRITEVWREIQHLQEVRRKSSPDCVTFTFIHTTKSAGSESGGMRKLGIQKLPSARLMTTTMGEPNAMSSVIFQFHLRSGRSAEPIKRVNESTFLQGW
jgi:hypothetical protein